MALTPAGLMALAWDADGPRRGTAVLLHGVMARAATWWRIGPALARLGWQTTAVDLPGHGRAPRLPGPVDLAGFASLIEDRLPARVDLLVGHSLGAVAALALAGRRPDRARALVLEDPPGAPDADPLALAAGIEADGALVVRDRAALIRRERAANPGWADEDVTYSVDGIAAADVPAIAAALRGRLHWDLPGLLAAVRVPVLVLAASQARGSALRGDRPAVCDLLPDGRFVVLDGGHCLHRDRPDEWLRAVTAFADDAIPTDREDVGAGQPTDRRPAH
jgi:pimeloyl-ACP methyl ester carboxylesterase